jgi:DNA-binding GntR family transcriptional regulator
LTSDPPASAVDTLAAALGKRILDGEFHPGEFLRDVKMAEEYATSRHTFRVAARTLVVQGLLRQIPHRGFFVPDFGPDDIVDITRLRGVLEGEAIRMIVLTGIIPPAAIAAVDFMRQSRTLDDRSALVTADRDFHRAIVDASGSERLKRSYDSLESEIGLLLVQRQTFYSNASQMADEHDRLIDSLRSRHYETARAAFLEHWNDLQLKLLSRASP